MPASSRRIGELLRISDTAGVADAHVALLADAGDRIITNDASDIRRLLGARAVPAGIIAV